MANPNHVESELKFWAPHVDRRAFNLWALPIWKQYGTDQKRVQGTDTYYRQGQNVIRHRDSGGAGQLTVKHRQSEDSITQRLEIDLDFADSTEFGDVTRFLDVTGWKPEMTLWKDSSIWFLTKDEVPVSLVYYRAYRVGSSLEKQNFIEVEVEKGAPSGTHIKEVLEYWAQELASKFQLTEPMNESLYEIYSGKKYRVLNVSEPL